MKSVVPHIHVVSMDTGDDSALKEEEPPSYKPITGNELQDLLKNEERSSLILDCRETTSFQTEHIKNSYNIADLQAFENERFATKGDIMQFYFEKLPTHIITINLPGHYDDIILYDDHPTGQQMCQSLSIMLRAISKWNANTKTQVWVLKGGYQSIAKSFPHLLDSTDQNVSLIVPQTFPPIINKFRDKPCSSKAMKLMESFEPYMKTLDESINKSVVKLDYKKKLQILERIDLLLKKDDFENLKKVMRNLVDDKFKCQTCKEVFSGIIYQCAKGHLICPNCSEINLVCDVGECGLPFKFEEMFDEGIYGDEIKIRTTTLEWLMDTNLAIDCPNDNGCGKTLMLNKVEGHAVECVKTRGPAGKRVLNEIELTKTVIQVVTKELRSMNRRLLELESRWLTAVEMDDIPEVSREFEKQLYVKSAILHELQISLMLEALEMGVGDVGK